MRSATNMNRQLSKDSNSTLTKIDSTPTETPLSTAPNSPLSESSNSGGYGNDTVSGPSNYSSYADYTSRNVSENIEEEEPQISERAAAEYNDDDVSSKIKIFQRNLQVKIIFFLIRTHQQNMFSSIRIRRKRRQKT